MVEKFRLDSQGVTSATGKLTAANDRLSEAFGKLDAVLQQHDGCWGTDDIGKAFDGGYAKPAAQVTTSIKTATDNTGKTGKNLNQEVTGFEAMDYEAASRIDAASEQPGGTQK